LWAGYRTSEVTQWKKGGDGANKPWTKKRILKIKTKHLCKGTANIMSGENARGKIEKARPKFGNLNGTIY